MLKLVVLVCTFATAMGSAPLIAAPLTLSTLPITYTYPFAQPYNYRGPWSLAPGQPAEILGSDGRPLDTLEVNQARFDKLVAQNGLHILKKRSAALIASPLAYTAPFAGGYFYPYAQPYNYRGPWSLAPGQPAEILGSDGRPLDTLEVNQARFDKLVAQNGLHILKKRSAAHFARPLAYAAPILTSYHIPIKPVAYGTTNFVRHY